MPRVLPGCPLPLVTWSPFPVSLPIHNILALAGRVRVSSGYLHMMELLRGLACRGCHVALVCSRIGADMGSRETPFPVSTWSEVAGRWRAAWGRPDVEAFARRQNAQVIHVHGTGLGAPASRLLHVVDAPIVFTPHSASSHLAQIRRIQRYAGRVLALSESLREGLLNRGHVPREKLRVLRPGVELSAYAVTPPRMDGYVPVVGTTAPFEASRGQATFLEAAKLLLDSGREAEFVLAGDGPAEGALRRKARHLGLDKRCTFVTRLEDYRNVMAALDVFVRTALSSSMGHTVIQAMALGKPAVVVAAEGMLELVDDGRTGLLVPKGDTQAMARAVAGLLDDPARARAMGLAARAHIVEHFNMDTMAAAVLKTYEEVLE